MGQVTRLLQRYDARDVSRWREQVETSQELVDVLDLLREPFSRHPIGLLVPQELAVFFECRAASSSVHDDCVQPSISECSQVLAR
jgi:hypothetical protein